MVNDYCAQDQHGYIQDRHKTKAALSPRKAGHYKQHRQHSRCSYNKNCETEITLHPHVYFKYDDIKSKDNNGTVYKQPARPKGIKTAKYEEVKSVIMKWFHIHGVLKYQLTSQP
jgi:hypothetical protein